MWPYLSGAVPSSPRTELWSGVSAQSMRAGNTLVQGLTNTSSGLELLVGVMTCNCWQGPHYPNASSPSGCPTYDCGYPSAPSPEGRAGCLFDIINDPTQQVDLAATRPQVVKTMYTRLLEVQSTAFSPDRGNSDPAACAAFDSYGQFYGPFLP
jgi:hypothetical protein